ncbi:MAG: efflux RND transporter periplasmic adaptor subunit [Moraxellaceae bacterium]|nr:efflux RND transporter periplasmic adaptor subunit [Moraxellaceae bacterium]
MNTSPAALLLALFSALLPTLVMAAATTAASTPAATSSSTPLSTSTSIPAPSTKAGAASAVIAWRQVEATWAGEAVIEAERQSTVAAQTAGRIMAIHFRPGDVVKQGQVIMRIDPAVAQQQVAGVQAQVAEAQVALDNATREYERFRELFTKNYVSQSQMDQAEAGYKAAQARLTTLRASSGQASTTRAFADVTAPYAGVMSALHVEVGETAVPGTPLATGFDPAWLRASAQVPQAWIEAVRRGNRAWVEVPGANKWLSAARLVVMPAADPRTHTTEVRVYLPEGTGVLPGQFVRVHFVTGTARRLVVPAAAVLRRSEVTAVYVLPEKGRAQLRQVRLGERQGDGSYEVLAGLREGERVSLMPVQTGLAR